MKRLVIMLFVVTVLLGTTVTAFGKETASSGSSSKGTEFDFSVVLASSPASGFNDGVGMTFGLGMMLPQFDKNLQGRIELSYFSWSASEFGVDLTYKRVPIDFAGRYFIPTQNSNIKFYLQAGLELSYDEVEAAVPTPVGTVTSSSNDFNFGIVPGAGIDVKLSPNLDFVSDVRVHIITDSYATLQAGIAYHF